MGIFYGRMIGRETRGITVGILVGVGIYIPIYIMYNLLWPLLWLLGPGPMTALYIVVVLISMAVTVVFTPKGQSVE